MSEALSCTARHISVDDLFRVKSQVSVLGRDFWIRVLSEADTQARDEYAMRAMARRRKALATPGTPEHETYVESLDTQGDETLRQALLAVEAAALSRQAQNEISARLIPFPEDASDEEKTTVLEQREKELERVHTERAEWLAKQINDRNDAIAKMERTTLVALTKEKQIEAQGQVALSRAFMNYTLYAAVFKDEACQRRAFTGPEIVSDMPDTARNHLTDVYFRELDRITQLDLSYFFSMGGSKDTSSPLTDSTANAETRPEK